MIDKIPKIDFRPNQIVFIKDSKFSYKPAKIISKCGYGTYKIKVYGVKDEQYEAEYNIQEYTKEIAQKLEQGEKKDKKMVKFLKSAARDFIQFQNKGSQTKTPKICKQEEEQMEDEGNQHQNKKGQCLLKSEAIENMKISTILSDFNSTNQTILQYGKDYTQVQKSKKLLLLRFIWSLQQVSFGKCDLKIQNNIMQIINSNAIQPTDYMTSQLFDKLNLAIQYLKKNRNSKLRNYLLHHKEIVISGFKSMLGNYTFFLRMRQRMQKIIFGANNEVKNKEIKKNHNNSQSFISSE